MFVIWILTFLFIGTIKIICTILGLITIPLCTFLGLYKLQYSEKFDKHVLLWTVPVIMEPWQNYEDGLVAGDELLDYPQWVRILYWNCRRNPANGLRFMSLFAPLPKPEKVKFIASFGNSELGLNLDELRVLEEQGTFWYFAWQGAYANFRWEFKLGDEYYRFWIGTKVYPSSIHAVWNYQKHGIGTSWQIKKVTRFKTISN